MCYYCVHCVNGLKTHKGLTGATTSVVLVSLSHQVLWSFEHKTIIIIMRAPGGLGDAALGS